MEIGGPFNASDVTLLLPTENLPPSDSFWITGSSPAFQGCSSMVNLENSNVDMKPYFDNEENGKEEDMDHPEKKRRLNIDQVRFLERSFEVENKLGPDRKIQLAREVGLQPRQVAIWFQNRRARYKSKQLEKDYDILKASYDELKADYDTLFKQNENLKNEVELLKKKLEKKEKSKPSKPIEVDGKKNVNPVSCKVEDMNSAKSDVFDSESTESSHYTNVNHSSFLETANSRSDFSQDEEDNFSKSLMPLPCLPKIEDGCYNYPVETDNSVWFWPY